jgi:hypothetical protein
LTGVPGEPKTPWVIRPRLLALVASTGLLAGLAGAACRGQARDPAPPCSAVAATFLDIAQKDLDRAFRDGIEPRDATRGGVNGPASPVQRGRESPLSIDAPTRRAVEDQLPAMRDSLTQACADGRWSAAVRSCLVAASDHVSFEACEQQLTDDQRRDLDRANRGVTGSAP